MTKATAKAIPKKLQAVLWSTNVDLLDIKRDKGYIIHQILLYGLLEDIRWLFKTYTKKEIIDVFLHHPSKIYSKEAFHFVKNFILGLRNKKLPQARYVTAISGPIEPRSARSI